MIKIDRNRSQVPHKKETALFVIKLFFSEAFGPPWQIQKDSNQALGEARGVDLGSFKHRISVRKSNAPAARNEVRA